MSGEVELSLRVPPSVMGEALTRIEPSWRFVAQHGVGEISMAADSAVLATCQTLRAFAESHGGALVVIRPDGVLRESFDPWGTTPGSLLIQQRLVAEFDPGRILNPGLLPGRL